MEKEDQKLLEVAICGYLPYGISVQYEGITNTEDFKKWQKLKPDTELFSQEYLDYYNSKPKEIIGKKIGRILSVKSCKKFTSYSVGRFHGYGKTLFASDIKPLLYPIECLTKPITVEGYNYGNKFVPIEELAKVHVDWSALDFALKVVVGSNLTRQFNLKISWKYGDDPNPHFNDNLFIFIKKPNDNKNWVIDLLNQWHIDWRGLIAKGLAVDKTTI